MNNKMIEIPDGCVAKVASYTNHIIPDYQDNPLIEALPPILRTEEVINGMSHYPKYNDEERYMDSQYRIHMVDRIYEVFQPLPINIQLESKISRTIRQGYISRNPISPEYAKAFITNKASHNSSAYGFSIIGISGIGKTTAINHVLKIYPQVIVHSKYIGKPFSLYQITWLKLECPHDGSIKGIIYEFFTCVDDLIGTDYCRKAKNSTIDIMITMMGTVIRNTCMGMLIVDEIQHLSMAKSGGSEKMLNFFVNLVNSIGIPVILVGTPKAMGLIQSEFRQARRNIGIGGNIVCDRLSNGAIWDILLNSIWRYQWTTKKVSLADDINNALYEETQGIPDLLIKLYASVQVEAIISGKEEITVKMIKKVARNNFSGVQLMLKALRSGNAREIVKYEDIYIPRVDIINELNNTRKIIERNNLIKEKLDNIQHDAIYRDDSIERLVANADNKSDKRTRRKNIKPNNSQDIRVIIQEGAKSELSAYEAIKNYGYVKADINSIKGEVLGV